VTLKGQDRDFSMPVAHYLENGSLEIQTRLQFGTYRTWHLGYQMVTWPGSLRSCNICLNGNMLKSVRDSFEH